MAIRLIGLKVVQSKHWEGEKLVKAPVRLCLLKPQEKVEHCNFIHYALIGDERETSYAIFNPSVIEFSYEELVIHAHMFDEKIGQGSHYLVVRKGAETWAQPMTELEVRATIIDYIKKERERLSW